MAKKVAEFEAEQFENKKVTFACPNCWEITECTLVYGEIFSNPYYPCVQCDHCEEFFTVGLSIIKPPKGVVFNEED